MFACVQPLMSIAQYPLVSKWLEEGECMTSRHCWESSGNPTAAMQGVKYNRALCWFQFTVLYTCGWLDKPSKCILPVTVVQYGCKVTDHSYDLTGSFLHCILWWPTEFILLIGSAAGYPPSCTLPNLPLYKVIFIIRRPPLLSRCFTFPALYPICHECNSPGMQVVYRIKFC